MEKVYLSDAGPKVSPAIYGFWRWENEVASMEKIVQLCLELGINTFDHADRYGNYSCEKTFGELISSGSVQRSEIILFSKCGICLPNAARPDIRVKHVNTSADHISNSVENSLRNLKTDYLDVFIGSVGPSFRSRINSLGLGEIEKLRKSKNIGVSNFSVYQHQLLVSYLNIPVVSNHIDLNLLQTAALDNGALDYIKQKYMRPLAVSPLAGGRIENGTDEIALRVRKKLNEMAAKYECNIESIAVAWVVKLGALPLIGTLEESRIRNIVNSFKIDLEHQDWYELYQMSRPGPIVQD